MWYPARHVPEFATFTHRWRCGLVGDVKSVGQSEAGCLSVVVVRGPVLFLRVCARTARAEGRRPTGGGVTPGRWRPLVDVHRYNIRYDIRVIRPVLGHTRRQLLPARSLTSPIQQPSKSADGSTQCSQRESPDRILSMLLWQRQSR